MWKRNIWAYLIWQTSLKKTFSPICMIECGKNLMHGGEKILSIGQRSDHKVSDLSHSYICYVMFIVAGFHNWCYYKPYQTVFIEWWSKLQENMSESIKELGQLKRKFRMGFRNITSFNIVLLCKQSWRLLIQSHYLIVRVIETKYYPLGEFEIHRT